MFLQLVMTIHFCRYPFISCFCLLAVDDRLQLIDDDGLIHSQEGGSGTTRPPSEIAPLQLEGHPEAERSAVPLYFGLYRLLFKLSFFHFITVFQ